MWVCWGQGQCRLPNGVNLSCLQGLGAGGPGSSVSEASRGSETGGGKSGFSHNPALHAHVTKSEIFQNSPSFKGSAFLEQFTWFCVFKGLVYLYRFLFEMFQLLLLSHPKLALNQVDGKE